MCAPCKFLNHLRHINNGFIAFSSNITTYAQIRNYSKDKECCKDTAQTEGEKVEIWPKEAPALSAWRKECPLDPQPPNYDPYKIKVPNVVVPPLATSNVKENTDEDARELIKDGSQIPHLGSFHNEMQDLFCNSAFVHPDSWKDKRYIKNPKDREEKH